MSEAMDEGAGNDPLADAHTALDHLLTRPLDRDSDAELLDTWRELERLRRRLPALEHRLVREVEERGIVQASGARNTAAFVRGLLRVDPREARGRVRSADACGSRRALTGERVDPAYPAVAAAQAAGVVSERHARVIIDTIEALPDSVRAEHGAQVEADLVGHAADFDPLLLARIAGRVTDLLDPDGLLHDAAYRHRVRGLTVAQRPDGSAHLDGELSAECAQRLLATLDSLAAPKRETDGVKDPRTAAQRRHDALLDALELVQRANLLPSVGGVSATVVLTMSVESWLTGEGLATTSHGALIPAADAIDWGGGDTRVLVVALDRLKAVTAYSSTHRIFTEGQRLALIARDQGCCFPGCDTPPAWTQIHHIHDYAQGGPTSIDNAAMLCGHHHREHQRLGWTCHMTNGRPTWTPPPHIDPTRQPRRNRMHDPVPA